MCENVGNKTRYFVREWGGMLLCLNKILRIYWIYRMVLHPVNRFILKIVFKMRGSAGCFVQAAFFFAALRAKKCQPHRLKGLAGLV